MKDNFTLDLSLARLRLEARSLIEWQIPSTSSSYRRVFSRLFGLHPLASSLGSTSIKKLLEIDDHGAILWYLSEVVERRPRKTAPLLGRVTNPLKESDMLPSKNDYPRLLEELIRFTVMDLLPSREKARNSNSQIADLVINSILFGDERRKQNAIACLLAISLDLGSDIQKKLVKGLEQSTSSLSPRPLSVRVQSMQARTRSIKVAFLVLLVVSTWIMSHFYSTNIDSIISDLAIQSEKINKVISEASGGSGATLTFIGYFIINLALILFIYKNRHIVYKIIEFTLRKIERLFRPLMLYTLLEKLTSKSVKKAIINAVNTYSEFLPSVVRKDGIESWTRYILSIVNEANLDTVRGMLNLLNDPDTTSQKRDLIFLWLCQVKLSTNAKGRY